MKTLSVPLYLYPYLSQAQDILYRWTLGIIRLYKLFEFTLFKFFSTPVELKVRDSYKRIGIEFYGKGVTTTNKGTNKGATTGGIEKNKKEWDLVVHNKIFFPRAAAYCSVGMGESYMDGWWDCDNLSELSYRILRNKLYREYLHPLNRLLNHMEFGFFNLQTQKKAWEVGRKHYDLGNDLFESFLDPSMSYSCGYWSNGARTLEEAQLHKMDLIARKLKLKPGMKVLDIGCGWGSLCFHLSKNYGVQCVGITVSEEGVKYAQDKIARDRISGVDIKLMDYRDLPKEDEKFDRILSVGMFEHVGRRNYKEFFQVTYECLKDYGITLLHTIGNNISDVPAQEPFIISYIFPNGYIPYYKDIVEYTEGLFFLEDWHNFGHDYSKTLLAWNDNFTKNWDKIGHKYGQRFFRMWTYYLQMSAGAFRARTSQLWQIVLSKNGLEGGYEAVR